MRRVTQTVPEAIDVEVVLAKALQGDGYTPLHFNVTAAAKYHLKFEITSRSSQGDLIARMRVDLGRPLIMDKALSLLDGFGVDPHQFVMQLEHSVRSLGRPDDDCSNLESG